MGGRGGHQRGGGGGEGEQTKFRHGFSVLFSGRARNCGWLWLAISAGQAASCWVSAIAAIIALARMLRGAPGRVGLGGSRPLRGRSGGARRWLILVRALNYWQFEQPPFRPKAWAGAAARIREGPREPAKVRASKAAWRYLFMFAFSFGRRCTSGSAPGNYAGRSAPSSQCAKRGLSIRAKCLAFRMYPLAVQSATLGWRRSRGAKIIISALRQRGRRRRLLDPGVATVKAETRAVARNPATTARAILQYC